MIRKLLATTAVATLISTGAIAQTTTPTQPMTQDPAAATQQVPMRIAAEGNLASKIIGESVYNGTGENAENIGKVNDLVIGKDGSIQAVVIGVGGFLGIGQKDVAIEYDLVQWVDRDDDRWMVVETTEDALKAQQEFDRLAYQPMPADAEVAETKPATADDLAAAPVEGEQAESEDMAAAPADDAASTESQDMAAAPADDAASTETQDMAAAPADDAASTESQDTAAAPADDAASTETQDTAAAPADDAAPADETAAAEGESDVEVVVVEPTDGEQASEETAAAPAEEVAPLEDNADRMETAAIDRNSLQPQATDQIAADDFIGTTVYGANEENVGDVGDIVLTQDGQVDAIIIDVGGFLGMGEKQVAVGLDKLEFMTDEDGDYYLYTNFTKEQLEAQPEYEEASYAERRDDMRMVAPN